MTNLKVKNLRTNSRLQRQLCKKYQSLIQLTGEEAYVKPTLGMYIFRNVQGQLSGFHFLILFLKTLKFGKFL